MGKVLGCCGIVCSNCDIYKATQNADNDLPAIVFERQIEWGYGYRFQLLYGRKYTMKDIHCNGCPIENKHAFLYIENCQMRTCALEKNLINCAYCTEYPCKELQAFFDKTHVTAKKTLDDIRSRFVDVR